MLSSRTRIARAQDTVSRACRAQPFSSDVGCRMQAARITQGTDVARLTLPRPRRTLPIPEPPSRSKSVGVPVDITSPSRGWWGFHPIPPEPRSIVELIRSGTLDAELGALLWLLV